MSGNEIFTEIPLISPRLSGIRKLRTSIAYSRHGSDRSYNLPISDITALRKIVIRGGFSIASLGAHYDIWKLLPFRLTFFVSSTFADTKPERRCMATDVMQKLRKLLKDTGSIGVGILPMDMRWAVHDENRLNQSWKACQVELKRSSRLSLGLLFLFLESDK